MGIFTIFGQHSYLIFGALTAGCMLACNISWFLVIRSVNEQQVIAYRNPFLQRMPLLLSRQFLRVHREYFPQSNLRWMARATPFLLLGSFLSFVGAMVLTNAPGIMSPSQSGEIQ